MPNVSFKQGLQENLNKSTTQKVAGAFYLTTDTNRLYYCDGTSFKDLNQYIHSVAAVANLPSSNVIDGDFYYAESENILCRYDSSAPGTHWVQINPDHNDRLSRDLAAVDVAAISGVNGAQVNMEVFDTAGTEVSGNFKILGSSNITVTPDAEHGTVTITTPDNVNTTYTLSTTYSESQGTINLTPSGDNPVVQSVHFIAGNNIGIEDSGTGSITISGQPSVGAVTNGFDANGVFTTTIEQGSDDVVSTGITPTISYGQTTTNAVFANGTAALNVYTQSEVDTKINDAIRVADAMTFKGVLGENDAVPTSNVRKGDTYKLAWSKDPTIPDSKVGDLIIAQGTEGTDGYISSGLTWALVPSGDEQVLIADNDTSTRRFGILDNNSAQAVNNLTFNQDSDADASKIGIVAQALTGNDAPGLNIVLSHGTHGTGVAETYTGVVTGTTQSAKNTIDIPTITGISKDKHGHVTSVTTATYRVIDTHGSLDLVGYDVAASNNSATFSMLTGIDGGSDRGFEQKISSSSLSITADNDAAGITIDLVWGSF